MKLAAALGKEVFSMKQTLYKPIYFLIIYVLGMVLTFDAFIWGRTSFLSVLGGIAAWLAVTAWIYTRGKRTIRKGEFLFLLSAVAATAIGSFLVAALSKEPEVSLFLSAVFLWPIGVPFQMLGELLSDSDENSILFIMIVPYLLIYFAGITGLRQNDRAA